MNLEELKQSCSKSARKYYITSLFTLLQTRFLSDFLEDFGRSNQADLATIWILAYLQFFRQIVFVSQNNSIIYTLMVVSPFLNFSWKISFELFETFHSQFHEIILLFSCLNGAIFASLFGNISVFHNRTFPLGHLLIFNFFVKSEPFLSVFSREIRLGISGDLPRSVSRSCFCLYFLKTLSNER